MNKYSYAQVLEASTEYFKGDNFAAKVFVDKYALQNKDGEYLELTPEDMHKRLSSEFARIEAKYPNPMPESEIYDLIKDFKYAIPAGSPMSAIGNDYQIQSVSNCFVIEGVHSHKSDSYGGIMLADQELAQIAKRRGGVGFDISGIRPKNLPTNNSAKTTDGIAVFMERFSSTCREVAQNGRRGALLLSISIDHPEIETFINIKKDLKKVTGANISIKLNDKFMKAVKEDLDYILHYPVALPVEQAKFTKVVRAKDIWNQIIDCAWTSAEPGVLFWDTIIKNTPSDVYADQGFESISTNPCFSGDTLIAVADGRNYVKIKDLAEAGKDVNVYSINKNGEVEIQTGRNPRVTGYNQKLLRITLDDGSHLDVTPDHKCMLRDGTTLLAKELKAGDSLPRFSKSLESVKKGGKNYYSIDGRTRDVGSRIFEHRLIAKFNDPEEWDKVYSSTKNNGMIKTGGLVVHHKDYNQLNNSPDNLQIMTFRAHSELHGQIDQVGEKNGMYSGITNEQLKEHALAFTKQLGRRFSNLDWRDYAKTNNLIRGFSEFRKKEFKSINNLGMICAIELNLEHVNEDPRVVKTLSSMIEQGYEARINNGEVFVKKTCEMCNKSFEITHLQRERAACSQLCSMQYLYNDINFKTKILAIHDKKNSAHMVVVKNDQAKVYSDLKFSLKREPSLAEWRVACEANNVTHRIGKLKFGFRSYEEVIEAGEKYNHKVVSVVELDGDHTVYNITVDFNHTVGLITKIDTIKGQEQFSGVFTPQCGEIILSKNSSCKLLALNLSSYVTSPFTPQASFNFALFKEHAIKSQRLMDDVVDLETECVDKILRKIDQDPEAEELKLVERNLWEKTKKVDINGRRTGLGITALADALAMLNVKYGSKESIELTKEIYKTLAVGAHTSSCIMAKERGAFPIFSYEKEKDHAYLNSIFAECSAEVRKMWKTSGRRNIALTTTAPTGSTSIMTQTSSGIEPVFSLSYTRRKKINPSDKNAKVDFVDAMGDKWQEFIIYHHGVQKWMDVTGETDIKKSPYWGATATEINWVAGVEIQGLAQGYVDHSISKTCVTKDALIDTNEGLFYMDELIDFNKVDTTVDLSNSTNSYMIKTHEGRYVKPSHIHTMKSVPINIVELENGLFIKVSARERFMLLDEQTGLEKWEYIENLSVGDRLKIK